MKKILELCTRNSFKLGLSLSYGKGATYNRGFAINFRPRSTRLKVGVRPIIEGRPILGNLRYLEILRISCTLSLLVITNQYQSLLLHTSQTQLVEDRCRGQSETSTLISRSRHQVMTSHP